MPNTRQELVDRFFVVNGAGKVQATKGVGLPNSDLDTRDKCTISRDLIVDRREVRDCRDEDLIDSQVRTRLARITLNYAEVTPQIIARWSAMKLGSAAAPTGTPADETQTLTVGSAPFTITLTLEGRTVTTASIPETATAAQVQAALTASRMLFLQPGDVVVTGSSPTYTITFPNTGRFGRANIPLMVATGTGSSIAAGTTGVQKYHAFSRSTSRNKLLTSFALGWDSDTDRVEKYIDYAVESITPNMQLNGDVGLTVVLVGKWGYDSIEETFTIPDCVNISPLLAQDCRVSIDGVWQTTDINSLTATANDNIPVDRLSAFPFDGVDIETLVRSRQPSYSFAASIFGSETDSLYQLALNERSNANVPVIIHFGNPGNRCTWNFPSSEVRFQSNPLGTAGTAEFSTIQIDGVPMKDGSTKPFNAEAYVSQTATFLTTA